MKTLPSSSTATTRVIGLGNVLLGDEGVGIHAVRHLLEHHVVPDGTDCIDGGTGGFVLLSALQDVGRVILIDATDDGQPPGTITRLTPRYTRDYPPSLAAHDIGLRDLLVTSELLGQAPDAVLFTISVHMPQALGTELSEPVAACLPDLADVIRVELARRT